MRTVPNDDALPGVRLTYGRSGLRSASVAIESRPTDEASRLITAAIEEAWRTHASPSRPRRTRDGE